jgi:hypothetical protein
MLISAAETIIRPGVGGQHCQILTVKSYALSTVRDAAREKNTKYSNNPKLVLVFLE